MPPFLLLSVCILLLVFFVPWFKQTVGIAQEDEKTSVLSTDSQRDHLPILLIGDSVTQGWMEVQRDTILLKDTDHVYGNDLHNSHSVKNDSLHFLPLSGQADGVNNGQQFTSKQLYGEADSRAEPTSGGDTISPKQPYPIVALIITSTYETNDIRSISKAVEFFGTWESMLTGGDLEPHNSNVSTRNTNECLYGMFEDHIYFLSAPGSGENYAIYRPMIGAHGCYEVYEWIGCTIDEKGLNQTAINVPYEIHHAEGTTIGQINQKESMRQWNLLGTYYFNEGTQGFVKISNNADGNVIADTFRFKYVGNSCQ
jgi:hypothetical protein